MFFNTAPHTTKNLQSLGLLCRDNPERITYGNLRYPTFFINTKKDTTILYGSCRKTHGDGEDALVKGDQRISENYLLLNERPSALFLLGDQIYADDIPDPLFIPLKEIGDDIIGASDNLWKIEPKLKMEEYNTIDEMQGRQKISEDLCGFTSTHASNHLFRFSEFASMYLLNWSPDLWTYGESRGYFNKSFVEIDSSFGEEISFVHSSEKIDVQLFTEQLIAIKEFKKNIHKVRRMLANVPTYMIFDDHDITDDWNLSKKWKDTVWEAPLGRHVIANGLATYWLFQGWGNDPTSFPRSFINTMETHFTSFHVHSNMYEKWINTLWNYDNWHFVAPTKPKALFLDTRTVRAYNKGIKEGPRLLNDRAYNKLTKLVHKQNMNASKPFIIISPAPVLDIHEIETLLKEYLYPLREQGIPVHRDFDLETWTFNNRGYGEFIDWILRQKVEQAVILSGDAHRAFSVIAKIQQFDEKEPIEIIQYTSSPFKNVSFPKSLHSIIEQIVSRNQLNVRYVDANYKHIEDGIGDNILWKETSQNLPLQDDQLMEFNNNIGLLQIRDSDIQNKLLK